MLTKGILGMARLEWTDKPKTGEHECWQSSIVFRVVHPSVSVRSLLWTL